MRRTEELKRAQQERLEKSQPQPSEQLTEQPPEEPPIMGDETMAVTDTTVGDVLPRADTEAARYITVATPLYEITLTTAGGDVAAVRLLDYETDRLPVQLIAGDPRVDGGALQVTLTGDEREIPLRDVSFEAFTSGSSEPLLDGTTIKVDGTTGEKTVVFRTAGDGGAGIERAYTFVADSYLVRSRVRFGTASYPFVRRVEWSFGPGLQATEKNVQDDYAEMRASLRLGDEHYRKKRGDFEEDFAGTIQWATLQVKYFTAIMLPEEPTGGEAHIASVKDQHFITASIEVPASSRRGAVDQVVDVYFGPLDYKRLKAIGRGLEKNVDVGFDHFKIFKPISIGILWSMLWLYKVIPNYGIVIILISVLTKVLFYRLTHKSFKSMRDMQALQPKLQALKEKHKDDRQKMSQETMKIYKEAGVNPLGGCLPMLLQMPVFIALFSVLRKTIELRQASFVWWMDDLSQQDVLFTLPFALPVIGTAVSLLPILMGGSMLLQSKIGGSIAGPSSTTAQPKAFIYLLPVVFTFLFYKMPSGLVLYWLVNTVLSVGQQYYINKGADKEEGNNAKQDKPIEKPKSGIEKPKTKPRKQRSKKG
jgi:YidC/Oxa1 family membrane protein insertase